MPKKQQGEKIDKDNIESVQKIIGYNFKNKNLLKQALTHSSAGSRIESYERLEFVGDRVLNLIIAEILYKEFPSENDGDLSKRLNSLVSKTPLAKISKDIGLDKFMIISPSEEKNNGRNNKSIQADILEAVIAAIYIDSNCELKNPRTFIKNNWKTIINNSDTPPSDYKSALQEYVQSIGYPAPEYEIINKTGPDHEPTITIRLRVPNMDKYIEACDSSRKKAEVKAAQIMLNELKSPKQ